MAQLHRDHCAGCGESFLVHVDEDGSPYSDREELTCECGDVICCQRCSDEHERCATCGKPLCASCGGNDLDGDSYCSEHLPKPVIQ